MPISIEQFKLAFAGKIGDDGGLKQRAEAVASALKRLKQSIDQRPEADDSADRLRGALKKLVQRYDAAREQVRRRGTDAAAELDKILDQTGHVMDWANDAPSGGSDGGVMAAPPPPEGGSGPPEKPDPASPGAAGDTPEHTAQPLKRGAQGPAVSFLQEQLNDEGAGLEVDGIFGRQTLEAVIGFQKSAGVNEKGVVGPLTWQALLAAGANGIDIDAAVTQARELHAQFEQAADPVRKGQLARKLLASATVLERRLVRALKDGEGRPKLTGQVQWDATASGMIADIAPFGARAQWTAASAASPPPKARKTPRSKSLVEEVQDWELKDGVAPLIVEVLDSKTGRPIPGATVQFDNGDSYLTEDDGRFRLDLGVGSWKIAISAPGYQASEDTFEAEEKRAVLRKTRLVPKDPATLDKVVMTVAVVDNISGRKIPKAKVTLGNLSGLTDGDGAGAQFHVLPGNYPFSATAQGYQKQKGRINVPESKDQEFHDVKVWPQSALAQELQDWELTDGKAPLIIEVLDSKSGRPIQGATVRFIGGETFTTKKDGRIKLNVKAPDSKKIDVSVPGYQSGEDSFAVEEKRGQLRTVRLVAKDPATLDKVVMNITAVDKVSGTKVPQARVTVGSVTGLTDRDGAGANIYILPGIYAYSVTAQGYHKEEGRISVPESKDQEFREFKITPQTALADELKDWKLEDGKAPLIIEVLDAKSGKPIEGATVRVVGGESFVTVKGGRLRLNVKAPDSKKIEVSAPGYQNGQDSFAVEEKRGQLRTVRLAPNSPDKVDKVLLAIIVADMTSPAKVANAKVTVGRVSGVTDANGIVHLRVLPGVYPFSVIADGYVKETGRLDVSERKDKQEQLIELRPIGEADIFVRVRRSGSRTPFEKAAVRLSNQIEYTNSNGEARFPKMPFGAHHLMVFADGYKRHEMRIYHNSQSVTGDFTEITLEPEKKP